MLGSVDNGHQRVTRKSQGRGTLLLVTFSSFSEHLASKGFPHLRGEEISTIKFVECENTVRFTVSSLKSQKHPPRNSKTQLPRVLPLGFSVLAIPSTSFVPSTLRMPPAFVKLLLL